MLRLRGDLRPVRGSRDQAAVLVVVVVVLNGGGRFGLCSRSRRTGWRPLVGIRRIGPLLDRIGRRRRYVDLRLLVGRRIVPAAAGGSPWGRVGSEGASCRPHLGGGANGAPCAPNTTSPAHCPPVRTVSDAIDNVLPSAAVALIGSIWPSSGRDASEAARPSGSSPFPVPAAAF